MPASPRPTQNGKPGDHKSHLTVGYVIASLLLLRKLIDLSGLQDHPVEVLVTI